MIFDENELLSGEKLRKLQLERLQKTVKNVYENVAFIKTHLTKKALNRKISNPLMTLQNYPLPQSRI